MNGDAPILIADSAEVDYRGLTYSPDGEYLYFVRRPASNDNLMLFRVRAFGGALEKLAQQLKSPAAVAPDGEAATTD